MIGNIFGKWTVIKITGVRKLKTECLVQCECGTERIYRIADLKNGRSKGCKQCRYQKKSISNLYPHSIIFDRHTYQSWHNMIARCTNIKHKSYRFYGEKGIKIYTDWLNFNNFINDMGKRPYKYELDRINPLLGYNKDNCRWIPKSENLKNQHSIKRFQRKQKTGTLKK